ncbi:MAG: pilus assembly protein PilM [Candidatus Magasanikbacteria bacterium]|nr:pilus assembly protein PilM [Candidatus Magasanikbacteria bacterium]
MSLFGKGEEFSLGVDFGAGGIKIVELKKTKDRPQLWTYGIASADLDIHIQHHKEVGQELKIENEKKEAVKKPANIFANDSRIEEYGEILKGLCTQSKVRSKKAIASLPVSYIFHAVINLPKVDKKELEHHVRAKVKKMTPRPIEELQVAHQIIPPSSEGEKNKFMKVLVTAAPKDLVLFFTSIFQKAGLQLVALETEAFALERALVGKDKSTSMVVDIGAERTNFFIADQGLPLTHRSIKFGGNSIDKLIMDKMGISAEDAGQIKKDISLLPPEKMDIKMFESLVDPIVKEIQAGFDLFLHQMGNEEKRPEKIILTGGSAIFPPILNYIKQHFDVRVFVGDPWARIATQESLKPVLYNIGPRMSVAIGLAVRNTER